MLGGRGGKGSCEDGPSMWSKEGGVGEGLSFVMLDMGIGSGSVVGETGPCEGNVNEKRRGLVRVARYQSSHVPLRK